MEDAPRVPLPALALGVAGLAPFLWAAFLIAGITPPASWPLPEVLKGDGRLIMVRYGGIIMPFMAGVLWGFATRAKGTQAILCYTLSVLPALWWFFMPGTGVSSALINLATGFLGVFAIDVAFFRWGLTPAWWMNLRIPLTVIVVLCLAFGGLL